MEEMHRSNKVWGVVYRACMSSLGAPLSQLLNVLFTNSEAFQNPSVTGIYGSSIM
jgi:hypothetical protein